MFTKWSDAAGGIRFYSTREHITRAPPRGPLGIDDQILDYLSSYEYAAARRICLLLMRQALLRRGAVRTLDTQDYDQQEMSLEVEHRPETDTPIKNKQRGVRFIALNDETCAVLDDWLANQRPDVEDEYGREALLASKQGRLLGRRFRNTSTRWQHRIL